MIKKTTTPWLTGLLILLNISLLSAQANASDSVPTGQLPDNVTPTHYQLNLKINPEKARFSGQTSIDITIKKATKSFYLNGKELTINSVNITDRQGKKITAKAEKTTVEGVLRVSTDKTLSAGNYQITFTYNAPFNENLEGLHRVKDGGIYYAFTQMESISARLAFPSFDEPRFKTPYDMNLTVPENLIAVANTEETHTSKASKGWKTVTFATTKPLPTYLVAFFVGDFDVVEMPAMPKTSVRDREVPLRGIAAKGKGKQLQYALSQTRSVVEGLEDYFQIAYPYSKLDVLAVPDFAAGAMENAGAITYREQLLLLDDKASIGQKRSSISVQAHELAHQWFGNLVTPVWWNDIWLNEAFATWMAATSLERQHPGEQWQRQQIASSKRVMDSDSIPSARKIRNPIKSNSDIITAFDGITYEKGAGVLFMVENFMGKENFRKGVQKYMTKYAWGNTTAIDFFETIASVLPKDKAQKVVTSFKNFVEQAGVPLLNITQACKNNHTVLTVSQQRYAPLGLNFKNKTLWNIPACMSYEVKGKIKQQCNVISKASQKITLAGKSCASWVMPNSKAAGYYRFNFDSNGWKNLLANLSKVNALEANAVLDSMKSSFDSGNLTVQNLIDVIPTTVNSDSWEVAVSGMATLGKLITYADEQEKAKLRTLAGNFYRANAEKVGFTDNTPLDKKDPIGTNQLRGRLTQFMAFTAKDKTYRKELTDMAIAYTGYKADHKFHDEAIIPALRSTAMSVAVQELGQPFVDELMTRLKASTDGTMRGRLIGALTSTENNKIGLDLINFSLTPAIRDNEKTQFLFSLLNKKELDSVMWPWLQKNFDQLIAGLPSNYQSYAPYLFMGDCKKEREQRLDSFLKPRLSKLVGADRNFVKAKDFLKKCFAQKAVIKPQITKLVMQLAKNS
ncbi:MAG: M1 family metallopeptidase [Alteromonadaceae bacterium]|nr:M1 family metallopeptidase [Alteromonadaceae bacterium]